MSAKNIKCPVDGRLFATKKALKQHNAASHANAGLSPKPSGSAAGQNGKPGKSKRPNPGNAGLNGLTMSGSDLIGTVPVTDTDEVGKLLLVWDINPYTLVNTRLAVMAKTFARWRPKKLHLTVVPSMGYLTPGAYAVGWCADPAFSTGSRSDRLQRVLTLSPNIMASFGEPRTLKIPTGTTQKWYFCAAGDDKETTHGVVFAILAGRVGAKNLTINFKLDWTVQFEAAELPATQHGSETYPDPSYLPIFTDSVSDWAGGTKLTFKHTSGGSVVPWVGCRSDMIYKPTAGTIVQYVKADKSVANVPFFAVIGGLYPTGMACFEKEDDAKAFVKSKDYSKAITYVSPGEYVTPALPTLQGVVVEEIELDLRLSSLRVAHATASAASSLNVLSVGRNDPGVGFMNKPHPKSSQMLMNRPSTSDAPSLNGVKSRTGRPGLDASLSDSIETLEIPSEDNVSSGES